MQGVDVEDPEVKLTRKSSVDEPFSALAFKIATDPFLGSLTFIRVYSGAPTCARLRRLHLHVSDIVVAQARQHRLRISVAVGMQFIW